MHSQPLIPVATRHDAPETSRRAAQRIEESGVARTQREIVLQALRRHPGSTAAEIAELAGLERHDPSRRLPELRRKGLVVNGAERVCRVTGAESLTWLPVDGSPRIESTLDEALIVWFREHRDELPAKPFALRPGERVSDPDRFYRSLESDIRAGPTAVINGTSRQRQRWLPTLQDLQDLKTITETRERDHDECDRESTTHPGN